ncbi:Elongator complex protein 4 [Smittium culicis]|uniref:Elongator complex protein 4 n=1 Tax=Smittium culicis TaxID=133412 RepID=A0A1R1XZ01_9FUNG|nr:Elongator complex protein 4 [Smittium culicis]
MSFRKIQNSSSALPPSPALPPGTKFVPQNSLVLVSTGIPSLDDVLGGGLAIGSILLVLQDRFTGYAQTLQAIFEAQAVSANHKLFVAKPDINSKTDLLLPQKISSQNTLTQPPPVSKDMKIAWRYNNLAQVDPSISQQSYSHDFDLSKNIPIPELQTADINTLDLLDLNPKSPYLSLFKSISQFVENGYSSLDPNKPTTTRNVSRISIHSLGSSFFQNSSQQDILQFFSALKGLLRYSYSTCMITIPATFPANTSSSTKSSILKRIQSHCDCVIELDSFEGSYSNPTKLLSSQNNTSNIQNDYHGLFHIHKLPTLNTLVPAASKLSILAKSGGGSSNNLAFKLRRKKFSIETYHLPIEGGSNERRVPSSNSSSKNLEF